MSVYFYILQSEASNSASFVLPNETFFTGHVLKKSLGALWLSSLLRRDTEHSLKSCIHFLHVGTAIVFYTEIFMFWLFNAHLCLD